MNIFKDWVTPEKIEFHIKVNAHDNQFWQIIFTNDNFKTGETVNNVIDLTSIRGVVYLSHQVKLFYQEEEAIELAKTLDTYEKCIEYNNKVLERYNYLLKYYKENPPTPIESVTRPIPTRESIIY